MEFTPTETSTGGIRLYITHNLSLKPRHGLNIYKNSCINSCINSRINSELKSTLTEVINPQKAISLLGVPIDTPL